MSSPATKRSSGAARRRRHRLRDIFALVAWVGLVCALPTATGATAAPTPAPSLTPVPSLTPAPVPLSEDGDDDDDDVLFGGDNVLVMAGVCVVVLCVACCFKVMPHLEYERAKLNNKIYPGTVMVVKPASPGKIPPLIFGPQSYDIPTPRQQQRASERATKRMSAAHKERETAMIEHERKQAEERKQEDLELMQVCPSPEQPQRVTVVSMNPLKAGRRASAGRGTAR